MKYNKTTEILFENEDYFLAKLDNGGVRVGMFEICAVDFPQTHPDYEEAISLTEYTIADFCDRQVVKGRWCIIG